LQIAEVWVCTRTKDCSPRYQAREYSGCSSGNLLLGDFGIAKLTSTSHVSITSTLSGTLAYMAPEQIMGQSTFASDQYALAIMVYDG